MLQKISIFLLLTVGLFPQASHTMQKPAPNKEATQELLTFIKNFIRQPAEIRKNLGAANIKTITDYARDADVNAQIGGKHYTLLHHAIVAEIIDPEFYTTLLNAGANPMIKDYKQRTARAFFDDFYEARIDLRNAQITLLTTQLDEVRSKDKRKEIIKISKDIAAIEEQLKALHDIAEILEKAEKNYAQPQGQLPAEQKEAAQAPAKKPKKGIQFAATLAEERVFRRDEIVEDPTAARGNDLALLHIQLLALSRKAA